MGKGERFHDVALAVTTILRHRRPDDLSVSRVARRAGVSRAWVYKHFGADTNALLDFAVRELADFFASKERRHDPSSIEAWLASIEAAVGASLDDVLEAPWALDLYFRYRNHPGSLGDVMRVIEVRYVDQFIGDMPEALRSRSDTRSFAVLFTNTRMNLMWTWSQPRFRADVPKDQAVRHLMALVSGWVPGGASPRTR
jgi:AcrR family transcriptional regulator